jgi:hypothetical protein
MGGFTGTITIENNFIHMVHGDYTGGTRDESDGCAICGGPGTGNANSIWNIRFNTISGDSVTGSTDHIRMGHSGPNTTYNIVGNLGGNMGANNNGGSGIGQCGGNDPTGNVITWNYKYNLWTMGSNAPGACDATDSLVSSTNAYVNAATFYPVDSPVADFHLAPGPTLPKGYVPASFCPTVDVDGEPRARNSCAAGADEP